MQKKKKKHKRNEERNVELVQKPAEPQSVHDSSNSPKCCVRESGDFDPKDKNQMKIREHDQLPFKDCSLRKSPQTTKGEIIIAAHDLDLENDSDAVQNKSDSESEPAEKVKRKRTRVRKRKRKNRSTDQNKSIEDASVKQIDSVTTLDNGHQNPQKVYEPKEVQKGDVYYGSLPDKLENPKNYRKRQTYVSQPNKHKTFDSDSESEEGTMAQFSFLCKPRDQESFAESPEVMDISQVSYEGKGQNLISIQNDAPHNPEYVKASSKAGYGIKDSTFNVRKEQDSFKTPPAVGYLDNPKSDASFGSPSGPTIMKKVVLANGVSLFKRVRTPNKIRELTKEEQLNTVATNKSTIFEVSYIF